jgi:hypothetical protein
MKFMRLALSVTCVFMLASCAAIKGTGNSAVYSALPKSATVTLQQLGGDPVVGKKIERMIAQQLAKNGFTIANGPPDLLVSYAIDVSYAGSSSTAYTTIRQAPQTAYVFGNTITLSSFRAYATTSVDTTREYQKSIAVVISKANSGAKVWEGYVTERGWCNQIFVTAPQILSLMFQNFPNELTNVQRIVTDADENAKEIRRIFPVDTSWGCQRS